METATAVTKGARPQALEAATLCEAFQATAAERADQVALRTPGDGVSITFKEYADRVERIAAGKNMSPANIEARLKASSPLIGQCIAIGDRRPYNVALIVLDPDVAAAFAKEQELPDASPAALAENETVQALVAAAVEEANSQLSRVEQIKRFKVLPTDWLPDSEELTPTQKLKRKPIAEKYAAEIEALYG